MIVQNAGEIAAENVLGNADFIRRLVKGEPSIAEKILNKIVEIKNALTGEKGAAANREIAFLRRAEKLYLDAIAELGGTYRDGKIYLPHDEEDDELTRENSEKMHVSGEIRYSMAGEHAKTADVGKLSAARQMAFEGTDSETIRQETGWFQGYDGKWRFEINDSDVEFAFNGKLSRDPDVRRYAELVEKAYFEGTATDAEQSELTALDKKLDTKSIAPDKLGDMMKHPALFTAYPQLADMRVHFTEGTNSASYHAGAKEITIPKRLKMDPKKFKTVILHEVQHAVQDIERFASGSNVNMFADSEEQSAYDQYYNTAGEIEARDVAARGNLTAEQRKNTRPDIDRSDVVFADVGGVSHFSSNDSTEGDSIKEQLKKHSDTLDNMDPVSDVNYTVINKGKARKDASEVFKKAGYRIDRQGFGIIEIGESQLTESSNYLNTPAEFAAWMSIPRVLKRGIIISGHDNHKQRGFSTVTIAAPILINGKRGNVAIVVQQKGKNKYHVHRILMPDGSKFVYENIQQNAEPTGDSIARKESRKGLSISSASNNSIPQNAEKSTPTAKEISGEIKFSRKAPTDGQAAKEHADRNYGKIYTRKDAREIISVALAEHLTFPEDGVFGSLVGKSREQAIEVLWRGLNSAEEGKRAGLALDMADFIIENAVAEDLYDDGDNTEQLERLKILRGYMHKLDLSSIKGEIEYKLGKKNTAALVWGARKGQRGLDVDVAAMELAERGITKI